MIGGTGLVGGSLVQKLLADESISSVLSVSRRPSPHRHAKLAELIVSDFSNLSWQRDKLKGDIYFCCLGTTIKAAGSQREFEKIDYDAVLSFAKIAQSNHAKCYCLISAYGANATSSIFYNRMKGRVEDALQQLKLKRLVIFRPSLLMAGRNEFRLGERLAIALVKALSIFLPESIRLRLGTDVEVLSSKLLDEGKKSDPGCLIFNPQEISHVA